MISKDNSGNAKLVGRAIAKYRKASGLSQAQVAELMGLSNDAISRMERGAIALTVSRLFEFAEIFGCRAADLLSESSYRLEDHSYQLEQLLSALSGEERSVLVGIIENIINWRTDITTDTTKVRLKNRQFSTKAN